MGAAPDYRKRLIQLIHVAKNERGLDEDAYRDLLERETSKRSCSAMNTTELDKVLAALKRDGFKVKRGPRAVEVASEGLRKRHKLREGQKALATALWISLWQLGAVRNKTDEALDAFVERQTGIAHLAWLGPQQAHRVIEALKDWCAREGFLVPEFDEAERPAGLRAKRELVRALGRKLEDRGLLDATERLALISVAHMTAERAQAKAEEWGYRLRAAMKEAS
ncbi:MAG: regulatory protein GemA [Parvibaculaceae bacterium]|nr:regulatory protein GemA [Parvibaculaceae bacterium]